jgi:hypothetical protein
MKIAIESIFLFDLKANTVSCWVYIGISFSSRQPLNHSNMIFPIELGTLNKLVNLSHKAIMIISIYYTGFFGAWIL